MKKLLLFIFPLVLVFVITAVFLIKSDKGSKILVSPLPELLSKAFSEDTNTEFWIPDVDKIYPGRIKQPDINAASILSFDITTNRLLYSRNIKQRVPLASLTKIMTAIIALENGDLDDKYVVSKKAAQIGENSMGLSEGEKITLDELLYGLILLSGNDAAEVIAENSKFGRENFVYIMNKKAEDLGLTDTHFTNPSGLEGDGKQYSSAFDLLVMTKYALENPDFAKIVSTVTREIQGSNKHKAFSLFNETNLLTSYPGVKGVKTGFTYEAGLCLVTYLEYDGNKIIAVLLNAQNRRQEMKDLLDFSLKTQGIKPPPHG